MSVLTHLLTFLKYLNRLLAHLIPSSSDAIKILFLSKTSSSLKKPKIIISFKGG